jgi:hypothetical protein
MFPQMFAWPQVLIEFRLRLAVSMRGGLGREGGWTGRQERLGWLLRLTLEQLRTRLALPRKQSLIPLVVRLGALPNLGMEGECVRAG